jgi:perosamine synthetase
MKNPLIPVCAPSITKEDVKAVEECVGSTWISGTSPYVSQFEEMFSKFIGVRFGIATNSGTTALHLALATIGIRPGDEVLLPTFTMIATINATRYLGAKPILIDSQRETWNMDVSKVKDKISKKTKAILPVHTYGHPVDMDPLMEVADKHGIPVIEDAAEAHGAEYKGRRVGSFGTMSCFSFYANKIITTGEGGMILTNDERLAQRAAWLRAHAFGRGGRHFWHEEIGYGYRLSGLQASLGISQLRRIHRYVEARRAHARLYNKLLVGIDGIELPPEASYAKNVYWMYSILITRGKSGARDRLIRELARRGIESRTFFFPLHRQPVYSDDYAGQSYPVADFLAAHGMNLPSGSSLNSDEIQSVANNVKSSLQGQL